MTSDASEARRSVYGAVSTALALRGDRELGELLESAVPLGAGIGGTAARLEVAGTPVFVKRVPLTERELRPEHRRSTANVFGLPAFCQYGVLSPGFGTWRELAAHTMTTDWVLAGRHAGFPLMYHWRVLPDAAPQRLPEELADVERAVAYFGGGAEIRHRIEALRHPPASLALFLEYLPRTLHEWLTEEVAAGAERADRAVALVERELTAGAAFMGAQGLLHFDAHFRNILTDGRRLYFADFGLAVSERFALSPAESAFFAHHRSYDHCYMLSWLVNWLITAVYGHQRAEREALIHAMAGGAEPPAGPPGIRALLTRHAPLAAVLTDFYGRVHDISPDTPYPAEELERAVRAAEGPINLTGRSFIA
ncbi:protein kinase family protein [Streptomyces sp. NPDC059477]|uniref:protein kinase family protein n=1 Tax=Streptomyces sp. NPDC059477 TaxID=3346847 RepID=UPI0036CA1D1D